MDTEETFAEPPSKSSETLDLYNRIFERLKRFTREDVVARDGPLPDGEEPMPGAIVVTFREREASWSKGTAKLYRVALAFQLRNLGTPDAYEALRMLMRMDTRDDYADDEKRHEAVELAKQHDARVARIRLERQMAVAAGEDRPRTSGQKAKHLRGPDLNRLLHALKESRSQWGAATVLWMMSGYLTGLRPAEWATAELARDERERWVLRVMNAKNTNGRSFGENRRILLSRLSATEIAAVQQHLSRARQEHEAGTFEQFYDGCRFLLRAVNQRLWPKRATHPTLYTARHMFASDAKQIFSRIEVAALMGHGSERTAGLHYGKRRHARGSSKVEPSADDVAAVTKLNPVTGSTFDRGNAGKNKNSGTYQ